MPLHSPPQHPSATRPCSCVIVDPARKWVCLKNALFLTWIFWGVGFNSATDNTPPVFLLAIQTPHAPSLKPSRLCYTVLPPLYYTPPFMRCCLKVHFSDKKEKKLDSRDSNHGPLTPETPAMPLRRSAVFSLRPPPSPTPLLLFCSCY